MDPKPRGTPKMVLTVTGEPPAVIAVASDPESSFTLVGLCSAPLGLTSIEGEGRRDAGGLEIVSAMILLLPAMWKICRHCLGIQGSKDLMRANARGS
jgi:hypothetical protein